MMEDKHDDTFLARWLSGDLSEAEKIRFENADEYQDYVNIIEGTNKLEAPSFDKQGLFAKIKDTKETKVRRLVPSWLYTAAAVVLLVVGLTYIYAPTGPSEETYQTAFGTQMPVDLPDGSQAILNAKSSITFNNDTWDENRTVSLTGEAYFKVKKGEKFTVTTNGGTVAVLGTQFNVRSASDLFEVKCTEGKVQVTSVTNESAILTTGKAFSELSGKTSKWDFNINDETWKEGESNFREIPLKYVIEAIQNQYGVTFEYNTVDANQDFTGTFSHENLNIALRTVFVPMEISYTFKDKNTIILKKAN